MQIVLDFVLRATVLLSAGLLLRWIIGRNSAEKRVAILRLTLATLTLLPLGMLLLPKVAVPVLPGDQQVRAVSIPQTFTEGPLASDKSVYTAGSVTDVPVFTEDQSVKQPTPFNWFAACLWAWGATSLLLLASLSLRILQVFRIRKGATPSPVTTQALCAEAMSSLGVQAPVECKNAEIASPMTFGLLRHTIFLPEGFANWSETDQRAVLLHEAAHIQRFDCAWQWLSAALRAVYWCHPLVWSTSRALRDDSELAADERAVRSGIEATDYAASLVAIARKVQQGRGLVRPQGVHFMQKSQFERRVQNVLHSRTRGFTSVGLLALCAAMLGSGAVIGAVSLTQMQPAETTAATDEVATAAIASGPNTVATYGAPIKTEDTELYEVAATATPEAWAPGEGLFDLVRSLTPVQKEIIASRGYLLPGDLSSRQKDMLGEIPNDNFSLSMVIDGQQFALRATRPPQAARSANAPAVTGYVWNPKLNAYQLAPVTAFVWDPKTKTYRAAPTRRAEPAVVTTPRTRQGGVAVAPSVATGTTSRGRNSQNGVATTVAPVARAGAPAAAAQASPTARGGAVIAPREAGAATIAPREANSPSRNGGAAIAPTTSRTGQAGGVAVAPAQPNAVPRDGGVVIAGSGRAAPAQTTSPNSGGVAAGGSINTVPAQGGGIAGAPGAAVAAGGRPINTMPSQGTVRTDAIPGSAPVDAYTTNTVAAPRSRNSDVYVTTAGRTAPSRAGGQAVVADRAVNRQSSAASVSLSGEILTYRDGKGNVRKWRVPKGSTVTLSGNGAVKVVDAKGKAVDLSKRAIK